MRSFCLCLGFSISLAFGSELRVVVDRPGHWEAEWRSGEPILDTSADGTVGVRIKGMSRSDVPGDLAAPRLRALIALPTGVDWKWDLVQDSTFAFPVANWRRVGRYDPSSRSFVSSPPREREVWSETNLDGFRLLLMDFPLLEAAPSGARIRKHLRIRLTWQGTARLPTGSPYGRVVDNPGGIRMANSVAARTSAYNASLPRLEGQMVEVVVSGRDTFSTLADGVVRLTGQALLNAAGLTPGVTFRNIAVYSKEADTLPTRMTDSIRPPALRPIPIQRVDRDSDGVLGPTDEIRFWAHAPNTWVAAPGDGLGWKYSINPYSIRRKYLIRLDAVDSSPVLSAKPTGKDPVVYQMVTQPVWVGKPSLLKELEVGKSDVTELDLGKSWYWLAREKAGAIEVPLGNLSFAGITSDSIRARPVMIDNTWFNSNQGTLDSLSVKGGASWRRNGVGIFSGSDLPRSGGVVRVVSRTAPMALAGLQLEYHRDATKSDSGWFPAPQTGSVDIAVPDGRQCWVVEEGIATRLCEIRSGRLLDSATTPSTWYAFFPKDPGGIPVKLSRWSAPSQKHVVKDFESTRRVDVLVITSPLLADIAEEYASHREAAFQVRKMDVAVVRTDDIYDLWSGGQADAVAIRDCIRWARSRWGVSHVLLLGGGHSDPRLLLGKAPEVQIPQWEDHSVSTDDFYTYLGAGDPVVETTTHVPAIPLGRVPAYSVAEAKAWLDKLKLFESPSLADYGPWRNTIAIAADDMKQGKDNDRLQHTDQSEDIADAMLSLRPWLRQEKLYLVTFPPNALDQKPEAARELQSLLNRGMMGLSYMGHGGSTVLADENLLDNAAIDRTLVNKTRPFLFFAGSCTVGRNDIPGAKGLSENLVISSGKGAAVAVSGTRTTYVDGNVSLSTDFWKNIVDTAKASTVGEALLGAKARLLRSGTATGVYRNHDLYNILGDPAQIFVPGGIAVSTSDVPDTIQALSRTPVRGMAVGAKFVQARMEVVPQTDTARLEGTDFTQAFSLSPKSIATMLGTTAVDSFSATLPIPARIPFGREAILRVYAWDPATRKDGGRAFSPRLLRGTAKGGGLETVGPSISIRPCDSSWSGGIAYNSTAQIHLPFCLAVDLFDSSGISSESGPDEGVTFSIPGVREPWHPELRQTGDYRYATAQLVIDSTTMLAGQTYPFDVLARDLMGNLSRTRLQVQVLSSMDYSLYEVFNSPNPVREGENTAFYFKLASEPDTNGTIDSRVQASIRIHSVSGKLVKVMRTELSKATQPRPRAVWNLRDSFGTPVANGIYPYTVVLRIPNDVGGSTVELVRKGIVAVSR